MHSMHHKHSNWNEEKEEIIAFDQGYMYQKLNGWKALCHNIYDQAMQQSLHRGRLGKE